MSSDDGQIIDMPSSGGTTLPPSVDGARRGSRSDRGVTNPPPAAGPLIVCESLVKIYKVADLEVVALQGLDLVVERGEFIALVGASGSGKSTLMSILGGLDEPSA